MKIALYGNTCNNLFNMCKALRGKGIDAHLYLNSIIDIQNKPESDEIELKNNYPEWIHQSDDWNPFKVIKFINFRIFIAPPLFLTPTHKCIPLTRLTCLEFPVKNAQSLSGPF